MSAPPLEAARQLAVEDALEFLTSAAAHRVALPEAQQAFRDLRARHPGVELELLWEHHRYEGTPSYDVLLRTPGGGTVSLGFAAERAVPWLLRSACHSHECDVALVNGRLIDIQTVVAYLDLLWNDTRLMEQMVDDQLIDEGAERLGVEPAREDVRAAVDEFRAARGLFGAAETTAWMSERGLSRERLEWIVSRDSAARALRRHVVSEEQVQARLEAGAAAFDRVHLARIRVYDEDEARTLVAAMRGDASAFFDVAERRFVAGGKGGDLFAVLTRSAVSPDQAALLFGAKAGDVIGPVPSGVGFDVVRILSITRATPGDAVARTAAGNALFAEWLAGRRATARVEWFWGNAGQSPVGLG